MRIAKELWLWCLQRGVTIRAQHLPGEENLQADLMWGHLRHRTHLVLNLHLFSVLNQMWGPLEIYLFATRFSWQLPRFFSWHPDPEAEATNALAQDWSTQHAYAHLPWCFIPRVSTMTFNKGVTVVIVTPCWPTQPWFHQLMEMLVDFPLVFPHSLNAQVLTPSPNCDCPVVATLLQLVAWKVSGVNLEQRQFQKRPLTLSWPPGEREPMLYTTQPGRSGRDGVHPRIPIPFRQA